MEKLNVKFNVINNVIEITLERHFKRIYINWDSYYSSQIQRQSRSTREFPFRIHNLIIFIQRNLPAVTGYTF